MLPFVYKTVHICVLLVLILFCIYSNADHKLNDLCEHKCKSTLSPTSYLVRWCLNEGFNISGRCCMNDTTHHFSNASVLGVSLSDCDIRNISQILLNFANLNVVLLDHNDITNKTTCPSHFKGLIHLNYLSLPEEVACPGGGNAWDLIQYNSNETLCEGRINYCNVTNSTCTDTSHCVDMGPGYWECQCTHPYYGYKCLRKGHFPTILFCALLSGLTVFLSVLLWCTQRRHVKKE